MLYGPGYDAAVRAWMQEHWKATFGYFLLISLIFGAVGAEVEWYPLVRIANGLIAAGFLSLAITCYALHKTPLVVVGVAGTAAFGYLTIDIWPTVPVWEVIGVIADVLG